MGIVDFFKNILKQEDSSYEKICEGRDKSKNELRETLKNLNFTEMEIQQAIVIIEDSERKISKLKAKLPGLSRRYDNPKELVNEIHLEIAQETVKMEENLRNKIQEIIENKNKKNNHPFK